MKLSEEDLKKEWSLFKDEKMWHCPECDAMLSFSEYPECNGQDPMLPVEEHSPHSLIKAEKPITFETFCEIMNRWFEPAPEPKRDKKDEED